MSVKDSSFIIAAKGFGRVTRSWAASDPLTTTFRLIPVSRIRTGVSQPKWKQIIADGGDATTSLTAMYDYVRWSPGYARVWGHPNATDDGKRWYKETWGSSVVANNQYANLAPLLGPYITDNSRAENLARAKFFKKVQSVYTQFQGMVALGELRETIRMLKSPAKALRKSCGDYLDALKKRKKADPRNWIKAISGTWLEYAFGWTPLLNDIQEAVKAYERLKEDRQDVLVSASAAIDTDFSSNLASVLRGTPAGMNLGCYFITTGILTQKDIIRYRGRVNGRVNGNSWDDAALFGFTPSQFAPTAWELLPWSFLVDYFTNIGDIINSVCTYTGGIRFAHRTHRRVVTLRIHGTVYPEKSGFSAGKVLGGYGSLGSAEFERKHIARSKVTGVPMPTLSLNTGLSDGQLANIGALLGQARALHPQKFRP